MVRETRHLWVGNLPENISEDRIREHFKGFGPIQSVKFVSPSSSSETYDDIFVTVSFMDICSAAKAHKADHKMEERLLKTNYYEPSLTPHSTDYYPSSRSSLHRESSQQSSSHLSRGDCSPISSSGSDSVDYPYSGIDDQSPRRVGNVNQSATPIPEKKFPMAIIIKNLPPWSSDSSLKDGLFHEYKKYGKITGVHMFGLGSDRYVILFFKNSEEAEEAHGASQDKELFGVKMQVSLYEGPELCKDIKKNSGQRKRKKLNTPTISVKKYR